MPELDKDQISEIEKLIEQHGVTRRLSSGQKWDVSLIVGAVLIGTTALAGLGIWQLLEEVARDSAANIAVSDVVRDITTNPNLKSEIFASAPTLPSGVVVAFSREKGQVPCPNNWTLYAAATGKFLLGANEDTIGQTGGEEAVTLTVEQMPKHRHSIPLLGSDISYNSQGKGANTSYFDYRSRADIPYEIIMEVTSQGVGPSGDSRPHNNMPPYIALYFCKKD